ncbi:MAG: prepilin-type N-terminal cleavage/methylation domain-containing protein [Thermodesulfovibrio sp.]|nr:prepilin-type N-terminal cleavage/methylation domain-containing protein [Thermodesulfovibrio sp.]MDW7998345.1 prepilin-type N-terminal cleavage/methylation domain-containing protein [Thermodesulfovibrio sp.]
MQLIRNHKGFTLIELAIVLIIIGVILGAVLKGQDLIQNARIKTFINKVRAWEIAQWNHYDRKGRFAGASGERLIGNGNVKEDLINAKFINPPYEGSSGSETNKITIGSHTFFVYFGNDGKRNIMTICIHETCGAQFTEDTIMYAEAFDTSIDGLADGENGQVIGAKIGENPDTDRWILKFDSEQAIAVYPWQDFPYAIIYYFDGKR